MQSAALPVHIKPQMLETERLHLRIDTEESYKNDITTLTDAKLYARYGFTTPTSLEAEKLKVAGGITTYRTSLIYVHLIRKKDDIVLGSFAFHNWHPAHRRSEIGYAMRAAAYQHQGYMKEAFPEMIGFGFNLMQLNRIEAYTSPDNIASRSLLSGAGFVEEGVLKEHYFSEGKLGDSVLYALLQKTYHPA